MGSVEQEPKSYKYRLDFYYQSIAVYAVTLVLYLIVRSFLIERELPVFWKDPFLYLLSTIILISVVALVYNLIMKRRITIDPSRLHFVSAVRERTIDRDNIRYVRLGKKRDVHVKQVFRVIQIGLKDRKRPIRIRPSNFENSKDLVHSLKEWAGPLSTSHAPRNIGRTRQSRIRRA